MKKIEWCWYPGRILQILMIYFCYIKIWPFLMLEKSLNDIGILFGIVIAALVICCIASFIDLLICMYDKRFGGFLVQYVMFFSQILLLLLIAIRCACGLNL